MKLVIILFFLINLKLIFTYSLEDKKSLNKEELSLEIQSLLKKSSTLNKIKSKSFSSIKSLNRNNKLYKTRIFIIKDRDQIQEKPLMFKASIKLADSFDIYEKQKLIKQISLSE